MLQMVQFECPRHPNLFVSSIFGEFPFIIFCLPLREVYWPSSMKVQKLKNCWNEISLTGYKWSNLSVLRHKTSVLHSFLKFNNLLEKLPGVSFYRLIAARIADK